MCPGVGLSNEIENGIRIVASISDDVRVGQKACQQLGNRKPIMSLAGRQHDPDWQTPIIHDDVDLGTQSSTRATNGVILAPFLPPAACWCARMIELSMN